MPSETPTEKNSSLLLFSLGPVQSFISTAASLKDLWSGSFILSWLTSRAVQVLLAEGERVRIVSPKVEKENFNFSRSVDPGIKLSPSFPNRFLAVVPTDKAESMAKAVEDSCRGEWKKIHGKVKEHLWKHLENELDPNDLWDNQCESFFEIRTAIFPLTPEAGGLKDSTDPWQYGFDCVASLMQAQRSVKHIPVYQAQGEKVPMKCSLTGTYEQMGPADLSASAKFWENAPRLFPKGGAKIRKRERFCAISLVKRYAWPAFFKSELNLKLEDLRYSDVATIAAGKWLSPLDSNFKIYPRNYQDWNGQWLHGEFAEWEEEGPDQELAQTLQRKKQIEGSAPTYYAILMADGDNMGSLIRKNRETLVNVSSALSEFSQKRAREIVESGEIAGELIYSGGDDVLALMPCETALNCAKKLNKAYRELMNSHKVPEATLSIGIAIVHYKEDLRFALKLARDSEKIAKK